MILYGASGHGKVVLSIVREEVICFVDDNLELKVFENLSVRPYSEVSDLIEDFVITIGDNSMRRTVSKNINQDFVNIISSNSYCATNIEIGLGNQIIHGSVVQTGVQIGSHSIINSMASIDHDCIIHDFVHIAPNCTLCGNVDVGDGTLIGAGSTIVPGIKVGKWSKIGAGSVVVNDIPDNVLAFGNPAKIIREIE